MKDFGGTGAWEAIRNWGSIIQFKLRFIKKIDRVLLLIVKRYVEWGLATTSISLGKNMGRALSSSAPHIPTTLIKLNFENF